MACACKTERAYYRDASGTTREAPGGIKWRCAEHAKAARARDAAIAAWLARWFPRYRLALPPSAAFEAQLAYERFQRDIARPVVAEVRR